MPLNMMRFEVNLDVLSPDLTAEQVQQGVRRALTQWFEGRLVIVQAIRIVPPNYVWKQRTPSKSSTSE